MKNLILLVGVTSFMYSCAPKSTETVAEVEIAEKALPAEFAGGKQVFDSKCHECHKPKEIDNYSKEQWGKILPNMAKKAELTAEETASIQSYIHWELQN